MYENDYIRRGRRRGGSMRKKRNRRGEFPIKAVALIALSAVIVLTVVLIIVFAGKKKGVTRLGAMAFSLDTSGVVIRDETCYCADKRFDRAVYLIDEGSEVTAGTPLARLYTWGYTDDVMQAFFDAEASVTELQYDILAGIDISDVDAIDANIDSLLAEARMNSASNAKTRCLHMIEVELEEKINERMLLLEAKVQSTEELTRRITLQKEKYEALSEWTSNIVAGENGRVSFYFDGFERSICADKLDILTASLIEDAQKSGKSYSAMTSSDSLIYKVVDDDSWYLAFISDATAPTRLTEGETYNVKFTGNDKTYTAVATNVIENKKQIINILGFSDSMGDFINTRVVSARITQEFSGIRVETDALFYREGIPYVSVISLDGVTQSVAVNILSEGDGFALVRPMDSSVTIHEGQDYIIP